MNLAAKLLGDSSVSVHMAAEKIGYMNDSYFSTAFKNISAALRSTMQRCRRRKEMGRNSRKKWLLSALCAAVSVAAFSE